MIEILYTRHDLKLSVLLHIDGDKHDPFDVLERGLTRMFPQVTPPKVVDTPEIKAEIAPSARPIPSAAPKAAPTPVSKPDQTSLF